jgi:hypothetical protein
MRATTLAVRVVHSSRRKFGSNSYSQPTDDRDVLPMGCCEQNLIGKGAAQSEATPK